MQRKTLCLAATAAVLVACLLAGQEAPPARGSAAPSGRAPDAVQDAQTPAQVPATRPGQKLTEEGKGRLKVLGKTTDGFVIAEKDLELRGAGEFFGTRQSGEYDLRYSHPVRDEALNLRPELLNSVKSLGAGRRALFRFVYLPSSFPIVLTTVRLSVGTAVAVLYFTEVTATYLGLGYYIFLMSGTVFDYAATYAGAIAMGVLGLVLYFFVDWLEKRLCPWKFAT